MLISLVHLMDQEEMEAVAQQLYTDSKSESQRLTWVAFRDAVAKAGTGPAFLSIEKWIESKKIEKEHATEIVFTMANAVRTPTEEYMRKFFEFVTKPEVRKQEYLNETALLAYTNLVNQVYINKKLSQNEFPVHTFGIFYSNEGKEYVKETVIPKLTQQLHEAIREDDVQKIHVFIRALGNIGHKKILEAFEPYLEGTKQASQFQRMLMVTVLDRLAFSYPKNARSVLYKIYQNTGETPEVRVVAVYQLLRTNLPVAMLQRMAENTHVDPDEQVNAAVKSLIETAATLKTQGMSKL